VPVLVLGAALLPLPLVVSRAAGVETEAALGHQQLMLDQGHELEDWLGLIDQRLDKLHKDEVLTAIRCRFLLIKVAALAAAAIEALED